MDVPRPSEAPTLAEIQTFVDGNIVVSKRDKTACGDGRTTPEQSDGAIRIFGADFGALDALKGALFTRGVVNADDQKLIDSYKAGVASLRGENPNLFIHTDTHAQEEHGIGCGHVKLASSIDNEGKYILPAGQSRSLYEAILARPETQVQVLDGPHKEQAVLLVSSEKNEDGNRSSVNSVGSDGRGSYFVVDLDGARDLFEQVVPGISGAFGVGITAEDAMRVYLEQQGVSADELAFKKGLEAFSVKIDKLGKAAIQKAQ